MMLTREPREDLLVGVVTSEQVRICNAKQSYAKLATCVGTLCIIPMNNLALSSDLPALVSKYNVY